MSTFKPDIFIDGGKADSLVVEHEIITPIVDPTDLQQSIDRYVETLDDIHRTTFTYAKLASAISKNPLDSAHNITIFRQLLLGTVRDLYRSEDFSEIEDLFANVEKKLKMKLSKLEEKDNKYIVPTLLGILKTIL